MIRATMAMLLMSTAATAQTLCATRYVVVAALAEKYSETRKTIAIGRNGEMVETFASNSGSWSVIVTNGDGVSCLVASGESFEVVADAPAREPNI